MTSTPTSSERSVDESFLNKMKSLVERLRLENATLKKSLDIERSEVRALKAQHSSLLRIQKAEYKKREEILEKQLRTINPEKEEAASKPVDIKKLVTEIQSLKAANKELQEKFKVAQAAECARAAELRAQAAVHTALEAASARDARAQCYKLLEEIKSKERVIIQLRREVAKTADTRQHDQTQKMESDAADLSRKLRLDQGKENNNREDLKTDIQHRKESFYREPPSDEDSAVSSAPASLSPQPTVDMWSCLQCRASNDRLAASARECARLTDALRDARDQLELMEFRLLELEEGDKGARDNLTDTDSGCVSPGSRIKDSASPELKRMDSGYKSPQPSSPCNARRSISHDEFKEEFTKDFAKAQILADILDRTSEASDSLRSNPVKDHLELMILNAASVEDRSCLEQVLMLMYNLQALSSSVSEDECYQAKPKKLIQKSETEVSSHKTQKAIATVTPYQQKGKYDSLDSLNDERKISVLQESGIFEDVETETTGTQTDVNDGFECTELNTEIQRLNSIREKLERQGVRNRTLNSKEDNEGLECRCVKLGKKHKQYYERRLKFLEGKISIYEAAQDVKEAKLAERLQKEFLLENRLQELESELTELHDKYEKLEEECCELEEIENDTRLHWQQLELDYELCSAQLREMTEQMECSRLQEESMMAENKQRDSLLMKKVMEQSERLQSLEKAVPALIAYNVYTCFVDISKSPFGTSVNCLPAVSHPSPKIGRLLKQDLSPKENSLAANKPDVENQIRSLLKEKQVLAKNTKENQKELQMKVMQLEHLTDAARKEINRIESMGEVMRLDIDRKLIELQKKSKITKSGYLFSTKMEGPLKAKVQALYNSEKQLKSRVSELEKREAAYLEMLAQADDMWAEMESGYKKMINQSQVKEKEAAQKISNMTTEMIGYKKTIDQLRQTLKEVEETDTANKVAIEKCQRDTNALNSRNFLLEAKLAYSSNKLNKTDKEFNELKENFQREIENLRKINHMMKTDMAAYKETSERNETEMVGNLQGMKKEMSRMVKSNQDLEVTNGELKEEVESLEKQLALTQKALNQCKRKCDEKIKTLSHELSIKTEELEELRSETMRQSFHASRIDLKPDRTEYVDEGYPIYTAVPKKTDYGRMHHSMSYISTDTRCSCPSMRGQLVSQLIEDLFDRIHDTVDDDLTRLCREISPVNGEIKSDTKAKIMNYLLMAISKELVRSIGDADAKTDTEEWQRAVSSMTYSVPNYSESRDYASLRLAGNAGVLHGAARLASVSCACAAARLCASLPELSNNVKSCQEEVLDHGDVKIMEEQLANAIESIVNCPSCALGTNAIVWSTDV